MKMLAIVIPYYKLTFFEVALDSLANQTDKRFKVYIGDDASQTDPTGLLEKYKEKLDIVYRRFETNLGGISLVKQWERCVEMTTDEEWLMVLGDDDYMSDNLVEEFYRNIDSISTLNIKVIRFATRVHELNGTFSKIYSHSTIEKATDFFYNKFFNASRGSLSEQIFSREAYLKHRFRDFPLGWGADNFAWLDFTDFGNIYTINEALVYFRISSENISRAGYKDELKREVRYDYFTILIESYLMNFNKKQRFPLLLYYEQLAYDSGKTSFCFWWIMCKLFFREKELIQIIKFTRRLLINYKKKQWSL
jgi:glycosyltransferase involved in cell wall biosynthesis